MKFFLKITIGLATLSFCFTTLSNPCPHGEYITNDVVCEEPMTIASGNVQCRLGSIFKIINVVLCHTTKFGYEDQEQKVYVLYIEMPSEEEFVYDLGRKCFDVPECKEEYKCTVKTVTRTCN